MRKLPTEIEAMGETGARIYVPSNPVGRWTAAVLWMLAKAWAQGRVSRPDCAQRVLRLMIKSYVHCAQRHLGTGCAYL